ncbi:hypothetical protein I7I53_04589 [Histoplasma capsulatum var. duboisii H88]|uniref:Uncharacterized protein n=1 Tax=Ajellomyces capsulatus (strain H88) TaxID=544711 RepID=A0A8A1LW72_AJEC8|nr:hypothetical protein I7I53_04589 [Histoplasma capsulatum var. duboisii H88]
MESKDDVWASLEFPSGNSTAQDQPDLGTDDGNCYNETRVHFSRFLTFRICGWFLNTRKRVPTARQGMSNHVFPITRV